MKKFAKEKNCLKLSDNTAYFPQIAGDRRRKNDHATKLQQATKDKIVWQPATNVAAAA